MADTGRFVGILWMVSTFLSEALRVMTILGIIFVIIKLIGKISWSWWWVLSPFWISLILNILWRLLFIKQIIKIHKEDKI